MVLRSAKPPTPIFVTLNSTVPLDTTASHPPSQKDIHDIHIHYPLRLPTLHHPHPSALSPARRH